MTDEQQPRRYTISIEVEVRDQHDFAHFQPNTVTARAPQLGVEWVSGNDGAALRDFFSFFLNWSHVTDHKDAMKGIQEIVSGALPDGSWDTSDYDDFVRGMTPASARYVYDLLRKRLGE